VTLDRALKTKQQKESKQLLRRALATISGGSAPIFQSQQMQAVVRTVERVGPSDVTILITGESGTGKEIIADLIHALRSPTKQNHQKSTARAAARIDRKPNCSASVKGAYNGRAARPRRLFRQREGGHAAARRKFPRCP